VGDVLDGDRVGWGEHPPPSGGGAGIANAGLTPRARVARVASAARMRCDVVMAVALRVVTCR
jgi:hypothetical protein